MTRPHCGSQTACAASHKPWQATNAPTYFRAALQFLGTAFPSLLDWLSRLTMYMPTCILMPMKRTAIFLKEEQIEKLQRLSDKTGAPVAELIRRAIDGYLKRGGKS